MDPIRNPFSPGAGSPPPELVGRSGILDDARVLLGRVRQKRPEKSMLLTGLRGVGKTVLLNEFERLAQDIGYRTVLVEAHDAKSLAALLAPHLRKILYDLDRIAGAGDKAKRALAVLKGFLTAVKVTVGDIEIGLDIDPARGIADTGDIEADLPELFVALAEAAAERNAAVAILIDEVQYLEPAELSALIMAMHKLQQKQLPLVLIGAGLPTLPQLAGESKSYAERLFNFPDVGPLSKEDATTAIREPLEKEGVRIDESALSEIFQLTQGYPYFLQEWGYQIWNRATDRVITVQDVTAATGAVVQRLDQNFFRVRFDRLTPSEKSFLRAMAHLGPGPCKTGDVADALGMKATSLGPVRASLIGKGMIYSPNHGQMAFTVPLFDAYMRRAIPEFHPA